MKVYVVTEGEYSDYRISGIFAEEDHAREIADVIQANDPYAHAGFYEAEVLESCPRYRIVYQATNQFYGERVYESAEVVVAWDESDHFPELGAAEVAYDHRNWQGKDHWSVHGTDKDAVHDLAMKMDRERNVEA